MSQQILPFRKRVSLEKRKEEYERIRKTRPSHVPVVAERGTDQTPLLDKEKYLVPYGLTAGQFAYVLRRRLKMNPSEGLFLLCEGRALTGNTILSSIKPSNDDGFMYVVYTIENAFGW